MGRRSLAGDDPRKTHPSIFESDEVIRGRLIYRASTFIARFMARVFHRFSIVGAHNVPKKGPALIVGLHTTHNIDTVCFVGMGHAETGGRVLRCLLHRSSWMIQWALNYFGSIAGTQSRAVELLKDGHLVALMPGGLEETLLHMSECGKQAYKVDWRSARTGNPRLGVAKIAMAMGPGFPVVPCFVQNGEEMKWNPIFDVWTWLGLDKAFGRLQRAAGDKYFDFFQDVTMWAWLILHQASIPVPVKCTGHLGRPVVLKEGETAEEFQQRVTAALQELIDKTLAGRRSRSYGSALQLRLSVEAGERKKYV